MNLSVTVAACFSGGLVRTMDKHRRNLLKLSPLAVTSAAASLRIARSERFPHSLVASRERRGAR